MVSYLSYTRGMRTILMVTLVCVVAVSGNCQFPDFLLFPTTNTWWSGPALRSARQGRSPFFTQMTVRGDLRRVFITYPLDLADRPQHPLHQHPFNAQSRHNYTSVQVDMRCNRVVDSKTETFIAEFQMPKSRFMYVCMRFQILDKSSSPEVFELFQGEGSQVLNDCSNTEAFIHRSVWIPNIERYQMPPRRSRCPLTGGFQTKNFFNLDSKMPICPSSVFVTIDSECIRGEGMEFHFNEPACNPFEYSLMTKFTCFFQWTEFKNVNAILVKDTINSEIVVASLMYSDVPMQADVLNNEYGSFTQAFIGLGIFRMMSHTKKHSSAPFPAYIYDLGLYDASFQPLSVKATSALLYEVHIRGAFGICDDELEQCEKGCNADARNRLFCRRSCPSVRKQCTMAHSDSCEINSSYRGLWRLIDPLPNSIGAGAQLRNQSKTRLRRLINISDRMVSFADVLRDETYYEFSCLREASEIVPDWYVLGGRQLQPGCHPRDICLEVYQNRAIFSNEAPNTNTLQFRISSTQRQGVDISSLCIFPENSHTTKQRRPQMLIKQPMPQKAYGLRPGRMFNPSKCEIYQIRLRGSIRLRAQLFGTLIAIQSELNEDLYFGQEIPNEIDKHRNTWIQIFKKQRDLAFLPEMVSCSIELSDFNPRLGTTGEFDGHLRLKSGCSVDPFSRFANTAHQCISVHNLDKSFKYTKRFLMLITYSEFFRSFFCWIFRESEVDGKTAFKIYLFLTPQCQYDENALGDITINNTSAIAIMHVAADKAPCLDCEQNTQPEAIRPPMFQQFRHLANSITVVRGTTAAATERNAKLSHLILTLLVHLVLQSGL
uniref:CUB domain-containing protein n=2 Tax=Mesocestoides corti TaxID=53468 RepID=A0A5K3F222_MESCO